MSGISALVLIVAYLGGYVFLTRPYPTRFRVRYLQGHRLLFEAGAWALPFLFLSRLVCFFLAGQFPKVYQAWHSLVPISFLGTAVGAVVLALSSAGMINLFVRQADARKWARWDRLFWMVRALHHHGSPLERLLFDCFIGEKMLAVNLKNDKVYVGYVVTLSEQLETPLEHFEILPMLSGYRRSESRDLVFTSQYFSAYQKFLDDKQQSQKPEGQLTINPDDFRLVIPVSEIYTISPFDSEFYRQFEQEPTSTEVSLADTLQSIGKAIADVRELFRRYLKRADPETATRESP